jgi:phosphoglycerate dehydrogenase-like enzyme
MPSIVAWIPNPDIAGMNFTQRHADIVERALGVSVRVCRSEEEFAEALRTCDIALCWRIPPGALAQARNLRWIATPAAGRDQLNLDPSPSLHISHGQFHGEFMAETVVGMMLAEVRGITAAVRHQAAGDPWPRKAVADVQVPLRSSHVVILGFGRIGEWIGRLCKHFGVRITGVRRHPSAKPAFMDAHDRVAPLTELDSVLSETDHLVVVLPKEEQCKHLLDARRLALLPPSAVLYSVGRGYAIDEDALAAALHAGRLRAAYLDVFHTEPLPADAPLRSAPRIVLMPHVSAGAMPYMDRFAEQFIAEYKAKWAGTGTAAQ